MISLPILPPPVSDKILLAFCLTSLGYFSSLRSSGYVHRASNYNINRKDISLICIPSAGVTLDCQTLDKFKIPNAMSRLKEFHDLLPNKN